MAKRPFPEVIGPKDIDGIAAMMVVETQPLSKKKGELDTEFVKRIVAAYMTACGLYEIRPIREAR